MYLNPHHRAWLDAHPHRSEPWLRERLADGFDVHHADGNHDNQEPNNLVLIEATDHTKVLHGLAINSISAKEAARRRMEAIDAAFEAAGIVRGSYVSKDIKGKRYWYFQETRSRKQFYIGRDFPYLRVVINGYNEIKRKLEKTP